MEKYKRTVTPNGIFLCLNESLGYIYMNLSIVFHSKWFPLLIYGADVGVLVHMLSSLYLVFRKIVIIMSVERAS